MTSNSKSTNQSGTTMSNPKHINRENPTKSSQTTSIHESQPTEIRITHRNLSLRMQRTVNNHSSFCLKYAESLKLLQSIGSQKNRNRAQATKASVKQFEPELSS